MTYMLYFSLGPSDSRTHKCVMLVTESGVKPRISGPTRRDFLFKKLIYFRGEVCSHGDFDILQ